MSARTTATRLPSLTSAASKSPSKSSPFLRFIFQPNPSAYNCCLQPTTQEFLTNPAHPYHIRIQRRIDSFDPTKLHWSVGAALDVAKKRVVRSWVTRRVREAVREELKARGWGRDGSVLEQQASGETKTPLRGALRIFMSTDRRQEVITASGEAVRENVRAILKEVVRKQVPVGQSNKAGLKDSRANEGPRRLPVRKQVQIKSRRSSSSVADNG